MYVRTEESSKRMSLSIKRLWKNKAYRSTQKKIRTSKAFRQKMTETNLNRWSSSKNHDKQSKALKEARQDPVKSIKLTKGFTARCRIKYGSSGMTPSEAKLNKLLISAKLPYQFTGDGRKCDYPFSYIPDFTHNTKHIVLELNGKEHLNKRKMLRDAKRLVDMQQAGYRVLVIWFYELDDPEKLLRRIKRFARQ